MTDSTKSKLPIFILFIGVASASMGAIFARLAQAEGIGSIAIAACRLALAALLLLPIVVIKYRNEITSIRRQVLLRSLLAGLFLAIHFGSWIYSLSLTSIASSVIIVTTTPVWVTLFSVIVYREKFPRSVLGGLGLALAGGLVVGLADQCSVSSSGLVCTGTAQGANPLVGNLLALLGAWMAAAYLLVGKKVRSDLPLIPYTFLVYGFGAVVLLAVSLATGGFARPFSTIGILWLFGLAIIPQLIGHSSLNYSLKFMSTTYVSIALLGEPICSTILGVVLFSEIPNPMKIMGGILIIIGIVIVTFKEQNKVPTQLVDQRSDLAA